jgi:hypothetical protein
MKRAELKQGVTMLTSGGCSMNPHFKRRRAGTV